MTLDFPYFSENLGQTSPFVVVKVFSHGAIEIKDLSKDHTFKVNRHRLKQFFEIPSDEDME